MTRIAVSFIGGFLLGVVAIWVYDAAFVDDSLAQLPELDEMTQEEGSETSLLVSATSSIIATVVPTESLQQQVDVRDQAAGSEVRVNAVALNASGWVVVHEENNQTIGNALGALRKDAGEHQDVAIPLLRTTQVGGKYWVVVYTDNGDGAFALSDDFPVRDSEDNLVMGTFLAQ